MLYEVIRLHARKVMLNTSPPTPAARQGHCNGLVFELVTAMRRPPIPPFAPHQRRGNNQGGLEYTWPTSTCCCEGIRIQTDPFPPLHL